MSKGGIEHYCGFCLVKGRKQGGWEENILRWTFFFEGKKI